MRKAMILSVVAGALALAGCQSEEADQVEDTAEAQAEQLEEAGMDEQADVVEEQGEEAANTMDDDGELAPSETGMGDTQEQ
jgi:protein involved in sex pheromone biosynthesis